MTDFVHPPSAVSDEDRVLRAILEGTAGETGPAFFRALVRAVARALEVHGAWVTEVGEAESRLRALAFWLGDEFIEGFEYPIAGTPCERVVEERRLVHITDRVAELYPGDPDLTDAGAASYLSAPLLDSDGTTILGNLALIHTEPLDADARTTAVLRIFAERASGELRRMRAEEGVLAREAELARLVESAMDAILGIDGDLRITRANPAAEKAFRVTHGELVGRNLGKLLSREGRMKLRDRMDQVDHASPGDRHLWVAGGLEALRCDGERFAAEATLSSFETGGRTCYTLILRDVGARLEAEQRLRHLTAETEYLREELQALENFGEIIGESEPVLRMLADIRRVASTGTTVLVMGETGTGKELVARAIHEASARRDRPLVRVNCAAVPASLMESEFFGHEKGAFTGATARREGRFSIANGGTIFLDEVGELPLELQAKLLRVLQEGEFDPVGSERTRRVDVRVIAATNRYLEAAVRAGDFREDLYYRLNVFPVVVPPLRERGDDVVRLAETFLERFSARTGRPVGPLTALDRERLRAYAWPGNVRELQNVIERAVITSRRGRVDLAPVLPDAGATRSPPVEKDDGASARAEHGSRILSDAEMKELERTNILRALEACGWQVSGTKGAAERLGIPPSTLASRMRSLEIRRAAGT